MVLKAHFLEWIDSKYHERERSWAFLIELELYFCNPKGGQGDDQEKLSEKGNEKALSAKQMTPLPTLQFK